MVAAMLDYEKYGNSFRTPKSMRPGGSPANNAFNGYDGDPKRPEGRPPGAMNFSNERRRPEVGPTSAAATKPNIHEQPVEQPTFLNLQRQGLPRPPMPSSPMGARPDSGIPGYDAKAGQPRQYPDAPIAVSPMAERDFSPTLPGGVRPPMVNQIGADTSRGMEQQLRDAWQNYSGPGAFVGSAARSALPEAYEGERFEGDAEFEDLPQAYRGHEFGGEYRRTAAPTAYEGQRFGGSYSPTEAAAMRETGQFGDPTGGIMGRTEQSVLEALNNPSAYNSDVVKNTFGLLAGQVDDDYNARDQALTASAARRGLGGIGDSTVISNDARFQNLQRRSAKEGIATNLLDKQATVFGQDRAAAIAQALGFGGQKFSQARDAYTTNRATDESNFDRDMSRRRFGADENARKFGFDMDAARFNEGIGQQGFENRFRTAEFGAGEEGRAFDAGIRKSAFNNDVGQRGFENATSRARGMNDISQQRLDNSFRRTGFNNEVGQQGYQNRFARSAAENDLNQRDFDNSRTAYNTNLDANQQGFNQRSQLLQQLLGYGQQGFENQITTSRENDRRDREQQELLLKLMGYA